MKTPETDKLMRKLIDDPKVDMAETAISMICQSKKLEKERNIAREKAEFWRSQYAKVYSRNSYEFAQQITANKLPWE